MVCLGPNYLGRCYELWTEPKIISDLLVLIPVKRQSRLYSSGDVVKSNYEIFPPSQRQTNIWLTNVPCGRDRHRVQRSLYPSRGPPCLCDSQRYLSPAAKTRKSAASWCVIPVSPAESRVKVELTPLGAHRVIADTQRSYLSASMVRFAIGRGSSRLL